MRTIPCRGCGRPIAFRVTPRGKYQPIDPETQEPHAARTQGDAGAGGVYFTPQPLIPAALARGRYRADVDVQAASDRDVQRYRWLLVDFDPTRLSGIASTDAEHAAAHTRAQEVRGWL